MSFGRMRDHPRGEAGAHRQLEGGVCSHQTSMPLFKRKKAMTDTPANTPPRTFPDDFIPATPRPDPGAVTASEIVAMAWDDATSFDAIAAQTGLVEGEVIKIMRAEMRPSSFRMWRKRVSGRSSKHAERG